MQDIVPDLLSPPPTLSVVEHPVVVPAAPAAPAAANIHLERI